MTLFLDMKFLESQLLWSLILQDDLFFFISSLPDHVYFYWPKYLRFIFSWKNAEMPKVNLKLNKLCIKTSKDRISASHTSVGECFLT